MTEISLPEGLPPWIKEHIELYLKDGEAAHLWDAKHGGYDALLTTLLLTTTGRKSGRPLMLPLIYRNTDAGAYCIIASKGGAPAHPAWFHNLKANPVVKVKVANEEFAAKARIVQGDERAALWETMAAYYPPYNDYQAATDREIPVVLLEK